MRPPATAGMALPEVDTPALLLDLDVFERNLALMAEKTSSRGIRLRPHAKSHKCATISLQQIALGAVGVCCQKVSEAESLASGGVADILLSNEVVGQPKLDRLVGLARQISLTACVDDMSNIDALNQAALRSGAFINTLIEINVGGNRCGVDPGEAVLPLAQRIASSSNLRFQGLQAYHGLAQHLRKYEERRAASEEAAAAAQQTVQLLSQHGFKCAVVTGGGTGTVEFDIGSGVYNEVQPGSYIFMDADYCRDLGKAGDAISEFRPSLFVYTQVMSLPSRGYAVVDAGLKGLAFDSGMPVAADMPHISYSRPSDEHGMLDLRTHPHALCLGSKLRLIPGHCDPTVNLYDWYVGVRGDRVEEVWPITARGALL
jgi:3-hydroxy-D-aspartate aldolase